MNAMVRGDTTPDQIIKGAFNAHDKAHRWVEHWDTPGGDPGPVGPRYGTLEEQAQMARAVTLYDSAIDAVTGDLFLLDSNEQSLNATVKSIRETLDRLHRQKREAGLV
jgi:hypothetical protein